MYINRSHTALSHIQFCFLFQQQLAKNIKFGQPPQMTVSVKTIGEANASLEADVLLNTPMETETQQETVLPEGHNQVSIQSHMLIL